MQTSGVLARALKRATKPHTVVALDDDPAILAALRRSLRGEPYVLLTAEDPDRVLEWIESRDVSIVVSDLRMPDRDGVQLLEEVSALSPHTIGVLLTAYPEDFPTDSPPVPGVHRVIPKPWKDGWLRITLRHLLWQRKGRGAEPAESEDGPEYDLGGEG